MIINILELLENSASHYPDKIFLADEEKSVILNLSFKRGE